MASSSVQPGKSALERLRKKRAIDAASVATLISIGWRQAQEIEGMLWCATCSQPTVWKDASGAPSHVWCSDSIETPQESSP